MKCIRVKGDSKVFRIDDKQANKLVNSGKCEYTSKTEWKEGGRK